MRAKDIAKNLGISAASVSLVMNNKPGVSDATRAKVLKAIQETQYGMGIKKVSSDKTVLFLVHRNIELDESRVPYFSQVFEQVMIGIESGAKQEQCKVVIQYIDNISIQKFVEDQVPANIDGIVLLGTEIRQKYVQMLLKLDIPIILMDNYMYNLPIHCVVINNEQGVQLAINHFIEKGHASIGYLHVADNANNFQERYFGFMRSMQQWKLEIEPTHIVFLKSDSNQTLYQQVLEKLSGICSLPTAFFADNDIVAIEAYKALTQLGYTVGEDISIIGFDDIAYSQIMNPPLTTIKSPQYAMGKVAVNMLMRQLENSLLGIQKVEIMTSVVSRQSVKQRRRLC